MAISAVNNTTAFSVFTSYTASVNGLTSSMTRMSTGVKSVMDDGAGVAISERMRSQSRSTAMARNNADNAISLLQTADGWLQKTNDMLARMHELGIEAQDGTKSTADKSNIQTEYKAMQDEISRITSSAAKFNGKSLFNSNFSSAVGTQVGADANQTIGITLKDLTSSATVAVSGSVTWGSVITGKDTGAQLSVASATTLANVSGAIDMISKTRASVGALQNRFNHTRGALLTYEDNLRSAESRVRDVDMARESAELTKYQILSQVGNAMLAQANQIPSGVLQLLG